MTDQATMTATEQPTKILFLTLPERGQSNCHRAVIHSLATRYGTNVELHLVSYSEVGSRALPKGSTFHPVSGKTLPDYLLDIKEGHTQSLDPKMDIWDHVTTRPGFWGVMSKLPILTRCCNPDGENIVQTIKEIEKVIIDVDPDLVVVDSLFAAGRDAADKLGRRWVILSPNTLKDNVIDAQGIRSLLWPFTGTGYDFPMPWYLIPLNAIILISLPIYILLFDSYFHSVDNARNKAGYAGHMYPLKKRTVPLLCMSTPELDLPGFTPEDVTCCGPILLPSPSLEQEDPALFAWVTQRSTILVSLGSHLPIDEHYAHALLESFRLLIDKRPHVQVLWKLRKWEKNYPLDGGHERIRITEWFDVDPISILPHVACVVNHGGSNSYHEALAAGVPQIILSPWWDCHDFGVRAEWLGVGKWGNRQAAPRATQKEFTEALFDVVGSTVNDPAALKIKARAKEVSDVIAGRRLAKGTKYGPIIGDIAEGAKRDLVGRNVAADWILKYAREGVQA